MQFVTHCFRVRPVVTVKAPVTLSNPVEKVYNNYIKMNAQLFVFASNSKYFFLSTIAQLALPKAQIICRKNWSTSNSCCKVFNNFCWSVANRNPIVHFFGTLAYPFSNVFTKGCSTNRRTVP